MLVSLYDVTVGETDRDLFLTDVEVDLGSLRTSDVALPLGHGSRPGVEYLDAGSLTLTLSTPYETQDEQTADAALSEFLRAWRRGLREPAGTLVPLLYETSSKARLVYGRPGKVDAPPPGSLALQQGHAELVAQFRVLDPLVYDAVPTGLTLSVVPRSLGGLVSPVFEPVKSTVTSGVEYRVLQVGGAAPTPLKVIFHGPALDPKVTVNGVEVGVAGPIAFDEDVVVDGRTRTVTLKSNGQPVASRLTRQSRLDRLVVEPGDHEVAFTATDRTGTARVTVEVNPAYYHL